MSGIVTLAVQEMPRFALVECSFYEVVGIVYPILNVLLGNDYDFVAPLTDRSL